jgi:hypothetical protein
MGRGIREKEQSSVGVGMRGCSTVGCSRAGGIADRGKEGARGDVKEGDCCWLLSPGVLDCFFLFSGCDSISGGQGHWDSDR